jgi:iron complex outermembrane recepter protein
VAPPVEATAAADSTAPSAEAAVIIDPLAGQGDVAADPGVAAPEAGYAEAADDVVRVTVDRRSKDIQRVSASAEAFSGEMLERKGVLSLRDMTSVTPYLEVGTQEGNFELYIRGVGNSNNTEVGDPAAATHIDGIYIPRPRGAGSMYYDLERVEVSRGPQGTLRGRNATAGTINIVTKQPELDTWGLDSSIQLGNYNQRLYKGMVNIPLGKDIAIRLAAFSERRDPFYKNEYGDPEIRAAEDADTLAYRASAKWQPTENVSLTLRGDNTIERGTGWVGTNVTQALREGILPEEIPDVRSLSFVGHQPSQSLDHWGLSAQLNVDFGPVLVELTSSYRDLDYKQTTGTTNGVNYRGKSLGGLDRYDSTYWHTTSESYVNELRVFAPDTAAFRWSAGLFQTLEKQYVLLYSTVDNNWGWSGQEYNHPDIENGAVAGFADATLDLMPNLRVLGGLRLTHDYKHRNGIGYGFGFGCQGPTNSDGTPNTEYNPECSWGPERFGTEGFQAAGEGRSDYEATPGDESDFLNGVKSFGARDTINGIIAAGGANTGEMLEQHNKSDDTFLDFRVGAEFDVNPDSMLYLTFSTGHKSGGFNDAVDNNGSQPDSFKPEAVFATELGSKNTFDEKTLTVNAAAFWYAYSDYQANTVEGINKLGADGQPLPPEPDGTIPLTTTSVRKNVGNARVLGLDFEVKKKFPLGFGGRVAGVLMDARFLGASVTDTRASWDPAQQPQISLKDKMLPRAPNLSITYGVDQRIKSEVGYFNWNISGQTKSKMYMLYFNGDGTDTFGNVNPIYSDVVPWTTRFDAGIGYTRLEGDISIDVFVSNLTDMTYMTSMINTPDLNLRFYNPPRQVGFKVTGSI